MRGMRLLHAAVLDTPGLEAGYGDVRESRDFDFGRDLDAATL